MRFADSAAFSHIAWVFFPQRQVNLWSTLFTSKEVWAFKKSRKEEIYLNKNNKFDGYTAGSTLIQLIQYGNSILYTLALDTNTSAGKICASNSAKECF